jgi:hypothetical protein
MRLSVFSPFSSLLLCFRAATVVTGSGFGMFSHTLVLKMTTTAYPTAAELQFATDYAAAGYMPLQGGYARAP